MKYTLVIDCNYLCYRSLFSTGELTFNGRESGIIFGFLNAIYNLAIKFDTNDFVFCWDSRTNLRKKIYPDYKKKDLTGEEVNTREKAFKQFHYIRKKILPGFGFENNFCIVGYEADDLIASTVMRDGGNWLIVSSDKDLYQLFSYADIYDLATKKLLNEKWFVKKYRIESKQWGMVKAVAGCDGDNVPGIYGVAEKTAIKYLLGTLNKTYKSYENIKRGKETIERNKKLVILPFNGLDVKLFLPRRFLSEEYYWKVCEKFGFESFNYGKWKKSFRLRKNMI